MPKGILWAVLQDPIAVPPLYPCGSPHHITLIFDVDSTQYQSLIGTEFYTFSQGIAHNADIQALVCDVPSRIPHKANPHITISYREGIKPSVANDMLKGDYVFDQLVILLKLKIEFYEWCEHYWVRNGHNHLGDQKWRCKYCGKVRTDSDRKVGRPK